MKRCVFILLSAFLAVSIHAQQITLVPQAGNMACSVRVPDLPRQSFILGLPETIASSEGMILNFPEVNVVWEGPDAQGVVKHAWTSAGKVEYSLELIPGKDYVDARMSIRNLGRSAWTNVFSFNCLNPAGAQQFQDWTLERTYMSKNGRPFRMDSTVRINNGSMSTVQFYLNDDYASVSPFIQGFKATSPDRTDASYIVTLSEDGTAYMAACSPQSNFLFDNLDRCCIHSATDFGTILPGGETTVVSRFYFAQGGLQDFLTRYEGDQNRENAASTRVAMCYGNPWVLADTTQWSEVLERLDILKIYIGNIDARVDPVQARAFMQALLAHDIKIAVELGGLLDWHAAKGNGTALASFQQDFSNVKPLIDLIQSVDPSRSIDMLDMDGPVRRMLHPSNSLPTVHTLETAVDELAKVVRMWRDSIPGIEINLLTNFPNWSWNGTPSYYAISGSSNGYGKYEEVLDAIEEEGAVSGLYFDGVTVDNPYDYATGRAQSNQAALIAGVDWMQRLAELQQRVRQLGWKVNMIFNTNGGRTAAGYAEQTLALIDLYHDRVGIPDGYWIQSWYQLPGAWLPETTPATMTHLTLAAMNKITPAQPFTSSYWGLRNIDMTLSGETYTELNPQYIAWGFQWDRLERPDDTFNWSYVDNAIDFTAQYGAQAVFLLTPASSWASGGEARAPDDLDRSMGISEAVPPQGYSEALYDYTFKIVDRAAKRNPSVLKYLRYGNEPQYPDHWLTSEATYKLDVEDYIRCLRTAYLAAHKAAADNNTSIQVSHGGFYYYAQLEREWYDYGEANPAAQDSLLLLFNSHYERQWPKPLNSWSEFQRRMQGRGGIPPTYWMDAIAGQTAWLDWFDIHFHFKPRYIFHDMQAFESVVLDSGGTLKPWFAAEAAMQIEAEGETSYEERFHAGDMARKWVSGMAAGLQGICTPIVGAPPDRFFGLYSDRGQRYQSADVYAYLHSLIQPAAPPTDLSTGEAVSYRFREKQIVDVVWRDALFDTVLSTAAYTPVVPKEFENRHDGVVRMEVHDMFGGLQFSHDIETAPPVLQVSQEPIVLLWYYITVADTGRALLEPDDGRVYHGVQTLTFTSEPEPIAGYRSALNDESIQPAVRGLFFSIPGTRGPAQSLRQLGEFFRSADSIGFIPELSLFLTSDASTDSIIALTDQYDDIIDSIITLSKAYGRAMFLRIGGEFNGDWNGYHPYLYVDMYRKITDSFAARGFRDSIATIWCYMPAAGNDFDSTDRSGALWYPGDDYVDWFGLDVFDVENFDEDAPLEDRRGITTKGKTERFLEMARLRGKPVYMSETSAIRINISSDPADGIEDWNDWFAKFWTFIDAHKEIKGFSYIDADWPQHAYPEWGDARIENSDYVSTRYREEMHRDKYIHLPWSGTSSADPSVASPAGILLEQNSPNPFRSETIIRVVLDRPASLRLSVLDMLGRELRVLTDGHFGRGVHAFRLQAAELPPGVYLYRLLSSGGMLQRKMILN